MKLEMKCALGHPLRAPYLYFHSAIVQGLMFPALREALNKYSAWWPGDGEEGYFFCAECFLNLLVAMEDWRLANIKEKEN